MDKLAVALIVMAEVTSVFALPVTQSDNVTWSTLCRHDVDLRPPHCADAAGSDVTVDATTTRTANATGRAVRKDYPYPYDPMLGWYTAAIISGLILAFVVCEGTERAKHIIIDYWVAREEKRLRSRRQSNSETIFVVAESASTPRDDDTTTTTVLAGVSATLRADSERTTSMCDRQRQLQLTVGTLGSRVPPPTHHETTGRPSDVPVPSAAGLD